MQKTQNLQDLFLNQTRKDRQSVTLFLMNGFQMRGIVRGFDSFTVVLETDGKQQLIYKHALLCIRAAGHIDRLRRDERGDRVLINHLQPPIALQSDDKTVRTDDDATHLETIRGDHQHRLPALLRPQEQLLL